MHERESAWLAPALMFVLVFVLEFVLVWELELVRPDRERGGAVRALAPRG